MYSVFFLVDYINLTLNETMTLTSNIIDYVVSVYFKVAIVLSIFLVWQMIYMLLTEKTCYDCENLDISVIDLNWRCTKNKDKPHKPHKYCSEFTDKKTTGQLYMTYFKHMKKDTKIKRVPYAYYQEYGNRNAFGKKYN